MGFLRRLRGAGAPDVGRGADASATVNATGGVEAARRVEPAEDDLMGDPVAHAWRDRLEAGEWRPWVEFLAGQPTHIDRDFYVKALPEELAGRMAWIDDWLEEEPDGSLAHLVSGQALIAWAWEVRTSATGDRVSKEQAERFFDFLAAAREELLTAIRLDATDGGPWAFMVMVAVGFQEGIDRLTTIHDRVQALDPWHPVAHRAMVQGLAPKWGGSLEAMLGFANRVLEEAPDGHVVLGCVPEAYLEAANVQGWPRSLRQPAVREALHLAASKSVDRPSLDSPWEKRVRNSFAVAWYELGETERLRRELEVVGPTVTAPWNMFYRDPVKEFRKARRAAGLG